MKTHTHAILAVALLLTGCAVGPQHRMPPVTVPDTFRGETTPAEPATKASLADQSWWDLVHDEELRSLIDEAVKSGYDVRLAAWRVEEARANAGIANSEFFPQVQAAAGWSRFRPAGLVTGSTETIDAYNVNIGLSWELDLWGRIRRLKEAALARYLATEEARRGVEISLVSEVASTYFELRALDVQLEIAKRTAEAFQGTYDLFDRRLKAGLASNLETSSASASLSATTAAIGEIERRIAAQENLLSFLVGRNPGDVRRGTALDDQFVPPEVPAGLPSELLRRRPDLREAEEELVAANADVGVAVANYFPRVSLTGMFGGLAPEVSGLFNEGKTWSVGGGLLTPIFQGARLQNEHRAAVARWEQAKVQYEKSVNNAFAEVSTALVNYRKLAEVEEELARAVTSSREAVRVSNSRYRSGLADYLEVLQAQRQLFPAETALAQTRFERLSTLVQLYRALGGGWQESGRAS